MKLTNKQPGYRGMVTIIMAVMVAWSLGSNLQAQSENAIRVNSGEAVTLAAESVTKLAIADPSIADVVALSDKEISIIGKKIGSTTLTIVRQDKPTQAYRIDVGNDTTALLIRKMVGSSTIVVRNVGDTVILDGYVNDEIEAQRAAQIAGAIKGQQVVNLIEVRSPRQIRIRTRVVEVNSDDIANVGIRWGGADGTVRYGFDLQYPDGNITHGFLAPVTAALQLLLEKGYAKLLSQPTLTTLSGKEASFLVGEEIPITQTLPNSSTVEYKEVGVRMKIKPTADSQNQINTMIHSEVSQVIGFSGQFGDPIISTKKVDTTLQVKDGQSIVIGGLIENTINRDSLRKVPWLADIPIFGFLFRHKEFNQKQREVIFFVTPEIVKDETADVASAAKTPMMKEWGKTMLNDFLETPKKGYDWGLQDPMTLGLPESTSKGSSAKKPAQDATPAAAVPAVEPTSNFTPARPTGQ